MRFFYAVIVIISLLIALIALIAVLIVRDRQLEDMAARYIPCPPEGGDVFVPDDPDPPSPFHDITWKEYERLYSYLTSAKDLNLKSGNLAGVNTSHIFAVDLLLPPKSAVLKFLSGAGVQPGREARVMIFRGDLSTPVVEELVFN